MLKEFIKKHFDYDIIGEVLEPVGAGRFRKRYIKKWCLRRKRNNPYNY